MAWAAWTSDPAVARRRRRGPADFVLRLDGDEVWAPDVADVPRADAGGAVVGLLGFAPDRGEDHLFRVPTLHRGPVPIHEPAGSPLRVTHGPHDDFPHYREAVAAAVAELRGDGPLAKVVLARSLSWGLAGLPEWDDLLARLAAPNPSAHTFSSPTGPGRALVGSSPERLLRRRGRRVTSHPLAGSVARTGDAAADRERARGLIASAKDRAEHAFVVEMIADVLAPWCRRLDVPSEPGVVGTDRLLHLGTAVTGELRGDADALTLARALQPTPAVAGTPTADALAAIERLEPRPRGAYAGAVGWCDERGDGDWAVALRCAEIGPDGLRAWAGAGIVADSDPDAEWRETQAKLRTFLDAAGISA